MTRVLLIDECILRKLVLSVVKEINSSNLYQMSSKLSARASSGCKVHLDMPAQAPEVVSWSETASAQFDSHGTFTQTDAEHWRPQSGENANRETPSILKLQSANFTLDHHRHGHRLWYLHRMSIEIQELIKNIDFGPVSIPGAAHPTRARRDTLDSVDVQKIPHRVIANADGNLFILAQNLRPDGNYDRIFYLVHSQVLCNTSPIFNKLFGRGSRFTERDLKTRNSSSPPNYVISGDPTAIGIALRILHHDNDCVPRSLGYRTLVELASLAERYEIRPALQLWMEMWAKEIDINEMLKPGYEEWIHVCWMFHLNGLQQISARLVKRARIHKDGSLCFTRSLFYNKFSGEFPPVVTGEHPQLERTCIDIQS